MATTGPVESDALTAGGSKAPVGRWKGFIEFLYNSKEGTVLGRTGKSWLQITIFYIIFYGVLAAFFAILLVLFLQTLDPNEPKWTTANEGIIGVTPGMGFRPIPPDSGSTLIWLKQSQLSSGNISENSYVKGLNSFLQPYEEGNQGGDPTKTCNSVDGSTRDKNCRFRLTELGVCNKEKNYGYAQGQPCVLLKLNRMYGWIPQTYNASDLPEAAKAAYKTMTEVEGGTSFPQQHEQQNQVYITCGGEDPVDQEHIGPISLHPRTLPGEYFPYLNQKGYLSPVVMVQFLNPSPGVLINVECKAWARNIKHSRTDRLGQVHFEILVDR